MVESYLRQSALAPLGLSVRTTGSGAGVKMGERPYFGMICLRGNTRSGTFVTAVEKALGFALPVAANTATLKGGKSALWMGPDEWLIITAPDDAAKVQTALADKLAGQHVAVIDVTDSRTIIELSGKNARQVLMKGCGIDFHPRSFGPGQCVQSTLALAHVMIHQTAQHKKTSTPTYRVFVHRSFAQYLWAWLEDAGNEYGIGIISG